MLDTLNRHLMHPFMAWRAGSKHLRHLRTVERTQFDPPDVIRARQLAALKVQLQHAWDTVPYYRAAWSRAGVHPSDVRELADLEAFPVLTKADIRRHNRALVSSAYDTARCRVKTTSGSTGVPLKIYCDEPAMQWKTACTVRSDQWSGYRLGQRVAKVWGNPEYRHFGLKGRLRNHFFDRAVYLDTLNLNDQRVAEFARTIRRHRPGLIFGHAHSLYLLACALKKSGGSDIRPNGIISTAMILHDWQRAVIEEVFGCKVTNRYGCEEVSLIASECEEHNGLHVNADSLYTEVPADGKLLITDICNRAMPLIRYQVGDVVVPSNRACRCGRGLPLIERVEGRDADYVLTPAGNLISGISLTENFAVLVPGAAQVQIVQESITQLRIRLVADAAFGDNSRRKIAALVQDTFGDTVSHEVELVDAIPQEPSGKYRFCISNVARERMQELSA
ncbi:Phenylacetate-coenzyme A ligase [Gemmata obscuriglobus]|uniref:Phenylacetate--CoA ligase family protein n=1 Tax=Gemmata obscuriglobus TaxID=114 RepID=A0A2Z3H8C1_9BACT|nr:phenylacetate--CoA ligase family protein [Gemmata obscuriglobus]AWM41958.1 phenylacetate--CoA ligase family protein [Gemmata obscuriglobus]QEG32060.1 Phenylacetate-coenzyme A ligase [Gemmata obscuriglobus]VTS11411.1 CapK related-protein OS=Desulfovibrio sp. X2 GN=dsx2_1185 PE=4 SV=1 [Gemmata obscuriglobus UQM 2246]